MSKHTPGPWGWYWLTLDGEAECGVSVECSAGISRSICRAPKFETREQWEANASLIAASPELLDELDSAVLQMEMAAECVESGRHDEAILHLRSHIRQKRAVIAKARGEA